jgi:hypothetical protein
MSVHSATHRRRRQPRPVSYKLPYQSSIVRGDSTLFDSQVTQPQNRKLDWKSTHRVNDGLFKSRQGLYPDRVIVADRDQDIKERVPLHHLDILCVALQHRDALVLIPRLHLPYPHHLVPTAGSKQLPGGAPRHALHLVLMPLSAHSTNVNNPQIGTHSLVKI